MTRVLPIRDVATVLTTLALLIIVGACVQPVPLPPQTPIQGTASIVVHATSNGAALSGATAALFNGSTDTGERCTTDDQGSCSFENLAAGSYLVKVSKDGYSTASGHVTVAEGKQGAVSAPLLAGTGSVLVIAEGSNGNPLSAVNASIIGSTGASLESCITGAMGSCTITDLQPGTYSISLVHTGYYTVSTHATVTSGVRAEAKAVLKAKTNPVGTGSLLVTIDDPNGNPLSAVNASILSAIGSAAGSCVTDATGSCTITSILPGTYSISFVHAGYGTVNSRITIETGKQAGISTAMHVAGSLLVTAVTTSGQAVVDVNATILDTSTGFKESCTTDATGSCTITDIPPATYNVTFVQSQYVIVNSKVTIQAGKQARISTAMSRAGSYVAWVTDTNNVWLGGVFVHLTNSTLGVSMACYTNSSGKCTINSLPPAVYDEVFQYNGYKEVDSRVTIEAGKQHETAVALVWAGPGPAPPPPPPPPASN